MQFVDYNIEFFHIDGNKFKENQLSTKDSSNITRVLKYLEILDNYKYQYSLNILIDEYNRDLKFNINDLYNVLADNYIKPHYIMKESKLTELSDIIIEETINNNSQITLDENGNVVLQVISDDILQWNSMQEAPKEYKILEEMMKGDDYSKKVTPNLDSGKTYTATVFLKYRRGDKYKYACPLLTASWYLMRLGVNSFDRMDLLEPISNNQNTAFHGKKLLNILSSRYLSVEATAWQIISLSPWEKELDRISYFFTPW